MLIKGKATLKCKSLLVEGQYFPLQPATGFRELAMVCLESSMLPHQCDSHIHEVINLPHHTLEYQQGVFLFHNFTGC